MNDNPWWIHFQTEGAFYAQNKRPSSWTFRWWQLPWIASNDDAICFMWLLRWIRSLLCLLSNCLCFSWRPSAIPPLSERDNRCVPRIKAMNFEKTVCTGDCSVVLFLRSNMPYVHTPLKGSWYDMFSDLEVNQKVLGTIFGVQFTEIYSTKI